MKKYSEIVNIFEGGLPVFIGYCQMLITEMKDKENEDFDLDNLNKENEISINELVDMIIEGIKSEGEIIKNKNIFYSFYDQNKEFYINHIINFYLRQENEEISRYNLEKSMKQIQEDKIEPKKNKFEDTEDIPNKWLENFYRKMKNVFKFGEILLIFLLLYTTNSILNEVTISELSIFNNKVISIFDESDYCIDKFNLITSANSLNSWMKGCYINT